MVKKEENIDIKPLNSFSVAGRAARMVSFTTAAELRGLLLSDRSIASGKWAVLGGGNNILFTRDYNGTLIHPEGGYIEIVSESDDSATVKVDAGIDWDDFTLWCVQKGLWGVENLSHIPSQVGAAPVQNIGAYGAEAKDIIASVEMVDIATLKEVTLANHFCSFGYRDSIFKHLLKGKVVITAVNFNLSKIPSPNLSYGALASEVEKLGGASLNNMREAVINIRKSKLPDPSEIGNAGSFFKNPIIDIEIAEALRLQYPEIPLYPIEGATAVKVSAAWLIESCGWKGTSRGNAGVYPKQALILVNNGGATGMEIVALARNIQADVKDKFDISIDTEVNIW